MTSDRQAGLSWLCFLPRVVRYSTVVLACLLLAIGIIIGAYGALGALHIRQCRAHARALILDKVSIRGNPSQSLINFASGDYAVIEYMPKEVFGLHPGFDYCFIKTSAGEIYESRKHFCAGPALDGPPSSGGAPNEHDYSSLLDLLREAGPFAKLDR